MSDFISFDRTIPGPLRINLVPNVRNEIYNKNGSTEWFRNCSSQNRVMFTKADDGEGYYLYICGKVLFCVPKKDKVDSSLAFLALSFSKDNFYNKNKALHSGQSFYVESKLIVSYFSGENSFTYYGGKDVTSNNVRRSCSAATKAVMDAFEASLTPEEESEAEAYRPTDELMEYLELAKAYSDAEYDLEEKEALKSGSVYYEGVTGCEYDRIENVAYRFYANSYDEEVFAPETRVELCDINDEKNTCTIIDTGKDEDERKYIDILFNKQMSLDMIPKVGAITLSFSSVNRDVQQAAINKIINGTADAKYMNDVLGDASPKGFDDINLEKLEKDLKTRKYPHNESQLEAIYKGIRSKDAYLVMGPPGTGKTSVILEWVRYFVKEKNMRVLISSQNNKAVDNVLEKVIGEEGINPLRIGSETKISDKVKSCLFEVKLEELREKIEKSTGVHKKTLETLSSVWKEVDNVLDTLKDDYNEKAMLEDKLNEACKNLSDSAFALDRCLEEYKRYDERLLYVSQKANELILAERKYRQKKVLIRILLKLFSWMRKFCIRYLISSYDAGKDYIDKLYDTYMKMSDDYVKLYDAIAINMFMPERNLGEKITENVLGLNIDYNSNKDKWGIFNFEKSQTLDIASSEYYLMTRKEIRESIIKAKKLTDELASWEKEATETSNHTLKDILLDDVNVVGATCIGINSQKRFADLEFDVSIIDEAGQIQIHNVLVPMSVSNKLIMLGDHKQIPPMLDEKLEKHLDENRISTEFLKKSLFEHMYEVFPDTNKSMLDTQYRMPSEIADILSEWFYDGKYKSFEEKMGLTSLLPILSKKPFLIIDTSESKNRFERNIEAGEQTIHDNPLEAEIASKIAAVLYNKGFDLKNVGIVAALKAQVDLIRKELKKMKVPSEYINELAATLDSYQGQERDVVVYSFGRSSSKDSSRNGVGFLTELRRLNVAMSRCKKTLVIIGDMKFLSERESVVGYKGSKVAYEKSEKNFSAFIRHMLNSVKNGAGEIIDVSTFEERLETWKNQG